MEAAPLLSCCESIYKGFLEDSLVLDLVATKSREMTVLDRILGYALRGPTCTDASVPSHAVVYSREVQPSKISPHPGV